jgi:hypothetical protein
VTRLEGAGQSRGVWLEEHATIRRPPADVFAFMDDAATQARVTPGVSEIRDVHRLANGGLACELVYRLAGFELKQTVRAEVYEPPNYVEYAVRGPVEGHMFGRYHFDPAGAHVELAIQYELPSWLDNALGAAVAHRFNRWALRRMIRTMARELEATGAATPLPRAS